MSTKFSRLELDLFVAHTCSHCFQPDEARARIDGVHDCPHLRRAYQRDQMPGRWTRRRNGPLGETFKCEDYAPAPPSVRRKTAPADTAPLFDVEEGEKTLVPVDGWPDFQAEARKSKEGDHQ
jgi:hypothetical protein